MELCNIDSKLPLFRIKCVWCVRRNFRTKSQNTFFFCHSRICTCQTYITHSEKTLLDFQQNFIFIFLLLVLCILNDSSGLTHTRTYAEKLWKFYFLSSVCVFVCDTHKRGRCFAFSSKWWWWEKNLFSELFHTHTHHTHTQRQKQ